MTPSGPIRPAWAGVVFKEGLTVRGLTTAASIWVTAAIGILVGIGFWFAAVVGAGAALIVLALFRYIESQLPSEFYAHHMLRFARDHVIGQEGVHKLIHDHGFTIANLSSRLSESGHQFEYRMTIKSRDRKNAEARSTGHMRAARLGGPPIADGPATSNESSITLAGDIVCLIAYVRKVQPNNGHRPVRLRRLRRCLVWTIIVGADPPGLLTN